MGDGRLEGPREDHEGHHDLEGAAVAMGGLAVVEE